MTRAAAIILVLLAIAPARAMDVRTRVVTNEISRTLTKDAWEFYQGESVVNRIHPIQNGAPMSIPTNALAIWYMTDASLTNFFLYETGRVDAVGGPVVFEVPAWRTGLDEDLYESVVALYWGSETSAPPMVVVDRAQVRVKWSPNYTGLASVPTFPTNGVLDAYTLVYPTFWTAWRTNLMNVLGIVDAPGLQLQIEELSADVAAATNRIRAATVAANSAATNANAVVAALPGITNRLAAAEATIIGHTAADAALSNQIAAVDASLTAASNSLASAITAIIENSEAGELDQTAGIAALSNLVASTTSDINAAIAAEEAARIASDAATSNRVALAENEIEAVADDLAATSNDLAAATALAIATERNDRIAADGGISNAITVATNAIAAEATTRSDADAAIGGQLVAYSNGLALAISAEATTRNDVDAATSNQLAATSNNLAAAISAEESARIAADAATSNQLAATSNTLALTISAEETARIAADAAASNRVATIEANLGSASNTAAEAHAWGNHAAAGYIYSATVNQTPIGIASNIEVTASMDPFVIDLSSTGVSHIVAYTDFDLPKAAVEYCDGFVFIPAGTNTIYVGSACATNVTINIENLPTPFDDTSNLISRIEVYGYAQPGALGGTNDFRLNPLLVRDPVEQAEPVPYGLFGQTIAAIRVDQWSQSPAVSAVDLDGQPLRFGDSFAAVSSETNLVFSWNTTPFLSFIARSASAVAPTATPTIVSGIITPSLVTLGVLVDHGWSPYPEYSEDGATWYTVASYASTYPTQTYGVVTITFAPPTVSQYAWYRVQATSAVVTTESELQVTADQLTLLGRRLVVRDGSGAVAVLSATGGLQLASGNVKVSRAGNITQAATNSTTLGETTAESLDTKLITIGSPDGRNLRLEPDEIILTDYSMMGDDFIALIKGSSGLPGANNLLKVRSVSGQRFTNIIWSSDNDGHGSGLDADTFRGRQDTDFAFRTNHQSVTYFAPIILRDPQSNVVATLTAAEGLRIGTATLQVDPSGNLSQNPTNRADLGQVTAARMTVDERVHVGTNGVAYLNELTATAASLSGVDGQLASGISSNGTRLDIITLQVESNAARQVSASAAASNEMTRLSGLIVSNWIELVGLISTSAVARVQADASLSNSLASLELALQAVSNVMSLAIGGEITNRIAALEALWTSLNAISNNASTAATMLAGQIQTNMLEQINADLFLANQILALSNSLAFAVNNLATNTDARLLRGLPPSAFVSVVDWQADSAQRFRPVNSWPAASTNLGALYEVASRSNEVAIYLPRTLGTNSPGWLFLQGVIR